jgi:hypothetical protein
MAQERTYLGGKDESTALDTPVERLLAKAVAHQVERAGGAVAEGKGEHAVDPRHGVAHPVAADQLEQPLGIRAIAQHYVGGAQFGGE